MKLKFSIIIPVFNRPQEMNELLASLVAQDFVDGFEVVVVEDGSTEKSDAVVNKYQSKLNSNYIFKENSGAGASRNVGMQQATGNYFIILDSDVLLPKQYLTEVNKTLTTRFTDAFGGPDAAHSSFTPLQKAINYSMTSVLTTGGIRGKKNAIGKFQPRSFNMGLSKKAFELTKGFADLKTGEDIDLSFRLWEAGLQTHLIPTAYVYHKRRSTLAQFYRQTRSFGKARPLLNKRYLKTAKLTYWFPSCFIIGFDIAIILAFFGYWQLLVFFGIYFGVLFLHALFIAKNLGVALLSIITSYTQFLGYGLGFLTSRFKLK